MIEPVARAPFATPVRGLTGHDDSAGPALVGRIRQVHGARVVRLADSTAETEADAVWTDEPGRAAAVRSADCVPILLAEPEGACVAAAHAGWRGLVAGVIAEAVAALPVDAQRLQAWIGPCIRQNRYEVGEEVRAALGAYADAFRESRPGHWQLDLAAVASAQLLASGVAGLSDCGLCTAADPRLPSHRRDGSHRRLWTMVWIDR